MYLLLLFCMMLGACENPRGGPNRRPDRPERVVQPPNEPKAAAAQFEQGTAFDQKGEYVAAKQCFQKAAEGGCVEAMLKLAEYCLDTEAFDLDYDPDEAIEWYKKAAVRGDVKVLYQLGQRDKPHAAAWYQQAAEQGHKESLHELAMCYATGQGGVARNDEEAFKCFQKAANKGHSGAMCRLGEFYEKGLGTKESREQAVKWYKKAAELGSSYAKDKFERLQSQMKQFSSL